MQAHQFVSTASDLPDTRARRRHTAIACAVTGLLAGLVYLNALHNLFIYDDHRLIVENVAIQHLFNVRAIVLHEVTRPIVNLSYAVDRAVWGPEPFGFHLTNVLLHMLNTMLLFQLTLRLLQDSHRDGRAPTVAATQPEVVAFASAALFAVHPIMTEAVGYASGRSEVLCAAFFFGAFLCARRWMLGGGTRWWLAAAACWLGALASKEIGSMLPFVLLAYDRLVLRGDAAEKKRSLRRMHLPFIAVAVVGAVVRLVVLLTIEHPGQTVLRWRFLLVNVDVVRRYLQLIAVPEGQTIFHALPVSTLHDARVYVAFALIAILAAVAWRLRNTDSPATLGLIWFGLVLVPPAVLVMLDHAEPMAEHRMYLAVAGLFIAVGTGVGWVVARRSTLTPPVRLSLNAVFCVALVSLAGRTVLRNAIWGNAVGLWEEARDKAPDHWLPHLLLGEALHTEGRHFEAIAEYNEARKLRPEEDFTYRKLGLCLIEIGELDRAASLFENLRTRQPGSISASLGLGAVAMARGDTTRARAYFLETIGKDAKNVTARQSLALLDEAEPLNSAEALRLCQEIRELAPATPGNDDCIRRNEERLRR